MKLNLGIFILFFLPIISNAQERINGILLEGIDYSGKTTVAKLLSQKLQERKFNVKIGHGELAASELNKFLMQEGLKLLDNHIPAAFPDSRFMEPLVKMHIASLMIDSTKTKETIKHLNRQQTFLIQDRYVLTLQCMQKFFTPNLNLPEQTVITNNYVPFKYNVYLTCDAETRNKRMKNNISIKVPNKIEKYFFAHLDKLQNYDNLCRSMVKDDPTWLVIDTGNLTVEQVADIILEFVDNNPSF